MIGKQLGQYRLDALLGEGGFGAVYRGVHVHMDSIEAAIKVAHAELARDAEFEKMMRRECEILYGLSHANIVRFRDLIVEDGVLAVAMELLEGCELADRLAQGPMEPGPVVALLEDMLSGLAYAHTRGVSHRDIKPANVFLCHDGTVKLMDFGIAKATNSTRATRSGMVSGTVDYMAPERFSGRSSPSADVYAVGLVAWEALVGRPACPEGDLPAKLGWHLSQGAPPLGELLPDCPGWLVDLVAGWCAIEVASRPATAGDAIEQLRQARAGAGGLDRSDWTAQRAQPAPSVPRPVTPAPSRAPAPSRRSRLPIVILLASLALLGVLVLGAAGVAWLVFAPVAPSGPESDPLVPLRAMQEELGELDGDLSSLEERAEVVMGAMDQALGPLVSSGDLDLALGALTTVGDAHGFMGHRWLEVQCHDAPSCPQLEAERLDRARDHFDTVLHNAGRMERLLEQNGVHDERVGMPEGMRHEAERALGELDERSRGEQPEGPESLLHELGEQLPWWDEWHGRLDACGHDGARALADQVRPVIEDAHRALEHGDPGAADAVLARAGELAPRVERMLSRCP